MATQTQDEVRLEIGHVLFIDIVGYSKLSLNEQRNLVETLNQIVRATREFKSADEKSKLVRLPTGDGMALVFYDAPEAPVECALEISRALKEHLELLLRMGIHSGPVGSMLDVNERRNIAGAGINTAQRVMDCGDAGHILLSKRTAEDLAHSGKWDGYLHDLGECEVKHGIKIPIVNLYSDGLGNAEVPTKVKQARAQLAAIHRARVLQRRKRIAAVAAAFVVACAVSALWFFMRTSANNLLVKSIAVLPFENVGDDKENAYLADGVQDEILTDLTKVADLKVISRRSVAQFRDTKQTIREIGKALGVAHVLEGSVRKIAGKIHVTAQLIDTRTETETWAEKYDKDIADIFQIQNDISQAIVTQLKVALSPAEKAAIEEKPTQDKEAYDLYLRARSLVHDEFGILGRAWEDNATKAIPLLESAIARDPKFALAYCVLGQSYLVLQDLDKAKEAIDAALRISPNSAEAHLYLARYYGATDLGIQDYAAAEKELAIAAAGLPGQVDVFNLRADVEEHRGKWKEALRDREKAAELDPRDGNTADGLVSFYVRLRRYDDAERLVDHWIAITPHQFTDGFWRAKSDIALARGDVRAAMAALDANPNRNLGVLGVNLMVANLFVMQRDYAKADEILQSALETAEKRDLLGKASRGPMDLWARAINLERRGKVARFRGEKDKARENFEAARPLLEQWLAKNPGHLSWWESHSLGYIAEIDAALGRKVDAIREGRKAVELWPLKRDAMLAPDIATLLAIVYMWTGERDAALQQLAEVAKLPTAWGLWGVNPTAGNLKRNPLWDDLRSDPRFEKIVADAAKPIQLD